MAMAAPSKICVVCRQDCSTKPRTKDARGRYYCKTCHEQAAAARPSEKAAEPTIGLEPSILDDLFDQSPQPSLPVAPGAQVRSECQRSPLPIGLIVQVAVCVALTIGVAIWFYLSLSNDGVQGVLGLTTIVYACAYLLWAIRHSYTVGGSGMQFNVYAIPGYVLYFAFVHSPSKAFKFGTIAWALLLAACAGSLINNTPTREPETSPRSSIRRAP